jgi:hypothetical protein
LLTHGVSAHVSTDLDQIFWIWGLGVLPNDVHRLYGLLESRSCRFNIC